MSGGRHEIPTSSCLLSYLSTTQSVRQRLLVRWKLLFHSVQELKSCPMAGSSLVLQAENSWLGYVCKAGGHYKIFGSRIENLLFDNWRRQYWLLLESHIWWSQIYLFIDTWPIMAILLPLLLSVFLHEVNLVPKTKENTKFFNHYFRGAWNTTSRVAGTAKEHNCAWRQRRCPGLSGQEQGRSC